MSKVLYIEDPDFNYLWKIVWQVLYGNGQEKAKIFPCFVCIPSCESPANTVDPDRSFPLLLFLKHKSPTAFSHSALLKLEHWPALKVHLRENFQGSDFEFFTFSWFLCVNIEVCKKQFWLGHYWEGTKNFRKLGKIFCYFLNHVWPLYLC